MYGNYIFIIICLVFSALFSGLEIAYVSANKLKIEIDRKNIASLSSKILSGFFQSPSRFIGTMLLGNNIALVIYGMLMSKAVSEAFIFRVTEINIPWVIILIQTLISTLIILVFAEFLPKVIFRINPNFVLTLMAVPVRIIYILLYPLVYLFTELSEFILKNIAGQKITEQKQVFTPVDLDYFIREFSAENEQETQMKKDIRLFRNAMDFRNAKVRECMKPRTEITAVDEKASIEILKGTFVSSGLSKILVYAGSVDNITGYVHSYEMFANPASVKKIIKPVMFIPEAMLAGDALTLFIKQKKNIAVVVDELGGTSGIVTMEDIIEEIFGEINDEFDKENFIEKKTNENEYLFSGRLEIPYLNDKYNLHLPESDDYNTLAGYILSHYESIPSQNEIITIDHFVFRIIQVSEKKIEQVTLKIHRD